MRVYARLESQAGVESEPLISQRYVAEVNIMREKLLILIIILLLSCSCSSDPSDIDQVEHILVGNQTIQIKFTSLQSTYFGTSPLSTTMEIENQSDQLIYLPWGLDPGFNLILVDFNSTSRRIFGAQLPTPSADNSFLSISPEEKMSSEFIIGANVEPGNYNLCAEILVVGANESDYQQERVCVPITYEKINLDWTII
ncbi:MAG: hypothetical protein GQ555_07210 [Desulfobacterales bacterium]|nr:hypothetical protein [Desulfobacterales bacterium]